MAVVIGAFMAPPQTGQLGLAVGSMLIVFSVFELLAFALMAAFIEKSEYKRANTLGNEPSELDSY